MVPKQVQARSQIKKPPEKRKAKNAINEEMPLSEYVKMCLVKQKRNEDMIKSLGIGKVSQKRNRSRIKFKQLQRDFPSVSIITITVVCYIKRRMIRDTARRVILYIVLNVHSVVIRSVIKMN